MLTNEDLRRRFRTHPLEPAQVTAQRKVRDMLGDVAVVLNELLHDCQHKAHALTALERAALYALKAIELEGTPAP